MILFYNFTENHVLFKVIKPPKAFQNHSWPINFRIGQIIGEWIFRSRTIAICSKLNILLLSRINDDNERWQWLYNVCFTCQELCNEKYMFYQWCLNHKNRMNKSHIGYFYFEVFCSVIALVWHISTNKSLFLTQKQNESINTTTHIIWMTLFACQIYPLKYGL